MAGFEDVGRGQQGRDLRAQAEASVSRWSQGWAWKGQEREQGWLPGGRNGREQKVQAGLGGGVWGVYN